MKVTDFSHSIWQKNSRSIHLTGQLWRLLLHGLLALKGGRNVPTNEGYNYSIQKLILNTTGIGYIVRYSSWKTSLQMGNTAVKKILYSVC